MNPGIPPRPSVHSAFSALKKDLPVPRGRACSNAGLPHERASGGERPRADADLPHQPRSLACTGAAAGGGRRELRARRRPHAGGGRRIGLRQVDARPHGGADRTAHRRIARTRRRGRRARHARAAPRAAPLGPARVPESVRIAESAQEDRRHPAGAAGDQQHAVCGRARRALARDARAGRAAARAP